MDSGSTPEMAARATGHLSGTNHVARRFDASTPQDAIAAMVGVGIPSALIALCWAGSTTLCVRLLVAVAVGRWGLQLSAAVLTGMASVLLFLAASWLRLMLTGALRAVGNGVCFAIIAVWTLGAVVQASLPDPTPGFYALLSVAWCAVSCWAAVKLAEQYFRPGVTDHLLYKPRDCNGRLLYVGITNDTTRRFREHAESKDWWHTVARIDVFHYPTRADLAAAEIVAIKRERPIHNVAHAGNNRRRVA